MFALHAAGAGESSLSFQFPTLRKTPFDFAQGRLRVGQP